MPKAFITGAAGFIGGYTVVEFLRRGWQVAALAHRQVSPELERLVAEKRVTLLRGDVTNDAEMARLLAPLAAGGLQAIIHCAGRASDVGRREAFRKVNFESVQILGRLVRELEIPRFVFVSTVDVYGLKDFHGEREEELPFCNNTGNPYPEYKIRAEQWLREALPPAQYAVIRPGAVWGSGDPTLTPRILNFLRTSPWIVNFGKWRGQNRWPLAHVRNVAAALYLAAVMPEAAGRAFNVLDNEVTTIDAFYHRLAEIYFPNKRLCSVTLPCWLAYPFAYAITALSNLLNRDHPIADPSLYALATVSANLDFSNAALQALFAQAACRWVTLEEGIKELNR